MTHQVQAKDFITLIVVGYLFSLAWSFWIIFFSALTLIQVSNEKMYQLSRQYLTPLLVVFSTLLSVFTFVIKPGLLCLSILLKTEAKWRQHVIDQTH